MSDITTTDLEPSGYADLREYVTSTSGWSHIALIDADGNEVTRIEIETDDRAEWSDAESNPISVTLEVEGVDSDIDTPVELSESALYPDDAAADAMHVDDLRDENDDVANVWIGGNDSLTVEHTVEMPVEEE